MKAFRLLAFISLLGLLANPLAGAEPFPVSAQTESTENLPGWSESANIRRANIPYFENTINWTRSAIFWFGINEQSLPGKNYVDVRLGYTPQALEIYLTVIDYYLWYHTNPQSSLDLSEYDAIALYLDTSHDRAQLPQTDDYRFLLGLHHWQEPANYQYEARGTGNTWDENWHATWTVTVSPSWQCNPALNDNSCEIDFGWVALFSIPWAALGYTSMPAPESLWGFGIQLFDRDDNPPAGALPPQSWPETFGANSPATWGEIHFGESQFTPPNLLPNGATTIRAISPSDNTVEDAWMGGGNTCLGGHEGQSETNHGADENLFVGSEILPTHFPCFSKTFLRFQLGAIPAGAEILSAVLTLHLFGNAAGPEMPPYSYVHLFTIREEWGEMSIHWNNAPLAHENISATRVYLYEYPTPIWPGTPYNWDATQAVAEAHTAGLPVNLALYASDIGRDTNKYFSSSETGDWNGAARPTLQVTWAYENSNFTEQAYLPMIRK